MLMRVALILVLITFGAGPAKAQSQKFSPRLHQVIGALENQSSGKPLNLPQASRAGVQNLTPQGTLAAGAAEPIITTMLVYTNLEALRQGGFEIGTTTKRVSVVKVPLSRIHELATLPGIVYVDIPTATYRTLLDVSMVETGGIDAHGGTQTPPYSGVTGQGVVVGIIDTGIDLSHEDFRDAGGNTRLLSLWDQTNTSLGKGPAGFNYGDECTAAEIDAGTCDQVDGVGHGSHVAGIAAGDGSEGGNGTPYTYVGVAPEADIVAVKFTTTKGDDAILDGVDYIFGKAGIRPAVVNISLGSGLGPHDGQTVLEMGLSDLTGPGRCIVAAAGNDGDVAAHSTVTVPKDGKKILEFTLGDYLPWPASSNDVIRVDAWYAGGANLQFTLAAPNGSHKVGPANPGVETFSSTNSGYLYMFNTLNNPLNGDRECIMQAYDSNQNITPPTGTWSVTITNNSGSRQVVDLWVYSDMGTDDGFPADIGWDPTVTNPLGTINSPGSADEVIAVGAYVTKVRWKSTNGSNYGYTGETLNTAASFSSAGPRRDAVQKPELAAPGMGIVSAISADAPIPNIYVVGDDAHTISQGTSQASPHVAGAVALLLEKNDRLTVAEIRDALQGSAGEDAHTFVHPDIFGAGRLRIDDAAASVTPVQLLAFTGERLGPVVTLRWETAEADVLFYGVQRSPAQDGLFTTLAQVENTGHVFSWVDTAPENRESWYRLMGVGRTGTQEVLATVSVPGPGPRITLSQNVPNPLRDDTQFAFSLDAASEITLSIVDLQGRHVMDVAQGTFPAGSNTVTWDGRLKNGSRIAAGMYFYRLTTPRAIVTKRLVVTP